MEEGREEEGKEQEDEQEKEGLAGEEEEEEEEEEEKKERKRGKQVCLREFVTREGGRGTVGRMLLAMRPLPS